MDNIFRLDGATPRDPAVEAWLEERSAELGAIARTWYARFRACGTDVREVMHDGAPTVCIDDAAFGYVNVYTAHVNVGFFYGAELDDPTGLLQGYGKRMRHVKLRPGVEVDTSALTALIDASYHDLKARLA